MDYKKLFHDEAAFRRETLEKNSGGQVLLKEKKKSKKTSCNLTYKALKWMQERWCSSWQ